MNESALEPQLTKFDLRVLNALAEWPEDYTHLDYRTAWQVAEHLGEYDVALVRDTLRGLTHLGYATGRNFGVRQQWVKSWRAAGFDGEPTESTALSGETEPHGRKEMT